MTFFERKVRGKEEINVLTCKFPFVSFDTFVEPDTIAFKGEVSGGRTRVEAKFVDLLVHRQEGKKRMILIIQEMHDHTHTVCFP